MVAAAAVDGSGSRALVAAAPASERGMRDTPFGELDTCGDGREEAEEVAAAAGAAAAAAEAEAEADEESTGMEVSGSLAEVSEAHWPLFLRAHHWLRLIDGAAVPT